jgi:hypothetical protein
MTQPKIKNFLRLTESDSVWRDSNNSIWIYDAQHDKWTSWSAVDEGGFWSDGDPLPNEDFAPYLELFEHYRED